MMNRRVRRTSLVVLLLLLAGCARGPRFNGELVDPPGPVPRLSGTNWDGKPFRLSEHRGKVVLLFFGYTYCPDVCPFTLAKMKQIYARLGQRAAGVDVVFVSVDPKRDTVEKLARYVPGFDRRFYGLRLSSQELAAVSQDLDVVVQFGQPAGGLETDTYYYVDHTATFFVIDRQGRLRLKFPPNATVNQMLPDVERLLAA